MHAADEGRSPQPPTALPLTSRVFPVILWHRSHIDSQIAFHFPTTQCGFINLFILEWRHINIYGDVIVQAVHCAINMYFVMM